MTSCARIAIRDPALWVILSNTLHLGCVSNKFCNVLSEGQCNDHEVSLHLVCFPNGSRGVKKTACRAFSLSFPSGSWHSSKKIEKLYGISVCVPSFLVLLKYHQSVPGSLVDNIRISCYPSSIRFLSCCCLAESAESNDSQKIILLHSVQTPSAIPIITVSQWYAPSCSRSSWSWWRIIFVVALDTSVGKPFLGERLASIVIHFLSPVGITVLYEQRINNRIAERVRTSLLVAFRSTSFLNAIWSSFHTRFFPFWFPKGCEHLVTGSELLFVVFDFIHKKVCFSGDHNVRCLHWLRVDGIEISNRYFFNNVHHSNTQELLHRLVNASPPVVLVRSSFFLHLVWNTMLKVSFFTLLVRTGFCWTVLRSSNVFSQTVSRCLCRRRYQKWYFFRLYTCQYLFFVHR